MIKSRKVLRELIERWIPSSSRVGVPTNVCTAPQLFTGLSCEEATK